LVLLLCALAHKDKREIEFKRKIPLPLNYITYLLGVQMHPQIKIIYNTKGILSLSYINNLYLVVSKTPQ
jgi:hypothetical protein